MISFIRKSIENGSLEVIDHISTEDHSHWEDFKRKSWIKDIRHTHRIVLKDTRTDEQVTIAIIMEGDSK